MDYVTAGSTGVQVSPLCLGTMSFGDEADEDVSAQMFHRARRAGINFFDTAKQGALTCDDASTRRPSGNGGGLLPADPRAMGIAGGGGVVLRTPRTAPRRGGNTHRGSGRGPSTALSAAPEHRLIQFRDVFATLVDDRDMAVGVNRTV